MDTPTHALIPVIIYGVMRQEALISGTREEKIATVRDAVIIGLVGALPDMLDPHVTLQERLTSWTHCLAAWAGFSALLGAVALARRHWLSPMFSLGLSLTYFSHLVGDAVAGGIGWAYPFSSAEVGDYFIAPRWWGAANILCVLAAYFIYRVMPSGRRLLRARRDPSHTFP